MIDLASHIEYLLMSHDCVVAPGLGAFLVHETPAYYDAETGRFMPPSRSLGFNQALTINDGLLAESVARKRGISLDMARAEVDNAIASFRHQLRMSSSLPVGNLGVMSAKDDMLLFEPSATSAVSLRYSGLHPLDIKPLAEDKTEYIESEPTPHREVALPLSLKIAASVIMIMVACGVFLTTNGLIDNRQTNFASLDSGLRAQVEYADVAPEETFDVSREIELNIAVPREEIAAMAEPSAPMVSVAEPGRYLLVVASFPSMKSALKHIDNDARLSVMEMEGKYRVYAASASTNADAHVKADELRKEFPSVWICRR